MTKKGKLIIAIIIAGGIAGSGLFLYVLVTAPRMSVQPHVRTYQMRMNDAALGTVAITAPARKKLNLNDRQALQAGRQFYDYYCIFCHGRKGDGGGPVGQSYDVTPADLRDPRFARMTEIEIAAAMVKGVGHEPALEYVVPEEYRSYLSAYVKTLR